METYQDRFSMNSDWNLSDSESSDFGATSYSMFSVLPTSFKTYQVLTHNKTHLIPVEIFSEVFLYTVQADPRSRTELMLVCRRWHDIMLSTPGIHSQLRIYRWTKKKDVERFGRTWLLDVTIDTGNRSRGTRFNLDHFYACFMAAAEAASSWRSLLLVSLPSPAECKNLQIMQPLQSLECFTLAASCCFGNFLEPLMTAIITTATSRLTVMEVFHPDASLYLVKLDHLHIFASLTTLRLICKRMQNVNILPHLRKLEIFEAHHLSLPIYPSGVDFPLIQTLRVLYLKAVSVQWMTGQIFLALQEGSIIFPHHADTIRSVYMPSCSILRYDSNNLGALEHFHLPHLSRLEVKCNQWRAWRGNLQLVALHPILAAQSFTCLHLEIKCSERLLVYMLGLVPALEELWMGLSSPHALSSAFFLAFAAGRPYTSDMIGPSKQSIAPLCKGLKILHLHYKRWLRGVERMALIPAFGDIVASHQPLKQSGFSLCLSFDEGEQVWEVHGPVEKFDISLGPYEVSIGFPGPHGIVPLSTASEDNYVDFRLFRELEYVSNDEKLVLPIDYFFPLHSLREVRMAGLALEIRPNTQFSSNLPFFNTLKVLHVWSIPSSFLAGQTFHKLEGYKEEMNEIEPHPSQGMPTEMPVCTRLIVQLSRLATLKLPQICELGVCIDVQEPTYIWEKHIAVNANLSGLKLLHLWSFYRNRERPIFGIIKILRSLPALETLVIGGKCLFIPYVKFFEAFFPSKVLRISRPNQPNRIGQPSGLPCPRLGSLQIEGISLTVHPELLPVLKDIVTLHAIIGSPLNSLTFYDEHLKRKWELIGRDRRFTMGEIVPAQAFRLCI